MKHPSAFLSSKSLRFALAANRFLSSTDCVVGSNPTDAAIFFFTTLLYSWSDWDYTPPVKGQARVELWQQADQRLSCG